MCETDSVDTISLHTQILTDNFLLALYSCAYIRSEVNEKAAC